MTLPPWPEPFPESVRRAWTLDPQIAYLNHGSFGACPTPLLERQQALRARLEREPVDFFIRDLRDLLDAARLALAAFVRADAEGLAFVNNATSGVNTVLRSLALEPGDELLTTSHDYGACRNALEFVAERAGARVVVADVPFPIHSAGEVTAAVLRAVSPRTRLAMIDHVTSATGLVLPVADIVRELRARGVDTLIDGAHALGMLDLDLTALGCTYYTANAHKWLLSPKGAAILYVAPERREQTRPLVISHGAKAFHSDRCRFRREFDWAGTDDPTAFLVAGEAIALIEGLVPGGWAALRAHNHALALAARARLCAALEIPLPSPDDMIGSLAAMPLGARPAGASACGEAKLVFSDDWQMTLRRTHLVEVPVFTWPEPPQRLLRISAQAYNRPEDYQRLEQALPALRAADAARACAS